MPGSLDGFDPRELLTLLDQTGRAVEDVQLRTLALVIPERAAGKNAFGVPRALKQCASLKSTGAGLFGSIR